MDGFQKRKWARTGNTFAVEPTGTLRSQARMEWTSRSLKRAVAVWFAKVVPSPQTRTCSDPILSMRRSNCIAPAETGDLRRAKSHVFFGDLRLVATRGAGRSSKETMSTLLPNRIDSAAPVFSPPRRNPSSSLAGGGNSDAARREIAHGVGRVDPPTDTTSSSTPPRSSNHSVLFKSISSPLPSVPKNCVLGAGRCTMASREPKCGPPVISRDFAFLATVFSRRPRCLVPSLFSPANGLICRSKKWPA